MQDGPKQQIGAFVAGRGEGIDLNTPNHWVISGIDQSKAATFFENLHRLLPPNGILYFEAEKAANDVADFYQRHRAKNAATVIRDMIFPAPEIYHVEFSSTMCEWLAGQMAQRPQSELFEHVKGYVGESLLFTFHDAFTGELMVSQSIPEAVVMDFCHACSGSVRVEETTKRDIASLDAFLKAIENPRTVRFAWEPRWRTLWRRLTGW